MKRQPTRPILRRSCGGDEVGIVLDLKDLTGKPLPVPFDVHLLSNAVGIGAWRISGLRHGWIRRCTFGLIVACPPGAWGGVG